MRLMDGDSDPRSEPKYTEADQPLDALVLEDLRPEAMCPVGWPTSPAMSFQPNAAYPYGINPFTHPVPKEKVYAVPKRFGMSALLAIMTALGFLFGGLRLLNTPPVVYLFLGTLVMVICLAQMFFGAVPRQASVVAGAVLLPVFSVSAVLFLPMHSPDRTGLLCSALLGIPIGGFVGYLAGTCTAGVFLLMDKLEPFLPGGGKHTNVTATVVDAPQHGA